jgi:uncharacterized membrane protein
MKKVKEMTASKAGSASLPVRASLRSELEGERERGRDEGYRYTQTYRHRTEGQTYRHNDIQTYRHTDIQTYRHTDIEHTDI